MIGWSKVNEMLHDMTPNRMLLGVVYHQRTKDTTNILL